MCKEPRDTKDCGWSKEELRVTSSTEPLSACFMKYHSRRREGRREGGAGDQGFHELKGCYAFFSSPISPFNPPPSFATLFFTPNTLLFLPSAPSLPEAANLAWHSTIFPNLALKKKPKLDGDWVGLLLLHVCVFFSLSFFFQNHQDNDHGSPLPPFPPPHIPLCSLLSPCLRFGFGARFEPPQWFPITPGFLVLRAAGQPRGFWLRKVWSPLTGAQ